MYFEIGNLVPRKLVNLYYCDDDGSNYILTVASGIISVNASALYVWKCIDKKMTVNDIAVRLSAKFPTVNEQQKLQIKEDVTNIIRKFLEAEAITLRWKPFVDTLEFD